MCFSHQLLSEDSVGLCKLSLSVRVDTRIAGVTLAISPGSVPRLLCPVPGSRWQFPSSPTCSRVPQGRNGSWGRSSPQPWMPSPTYRVKARLLSKGAKTFTEHSAPLSPESTPVVSCLHFPAPRNISEHLPCSFPPLLRHVSPRGPLHYLLPSLPGHSHSG